MADCVAHALMVHHYLFSRCSTLCSWEDPRQVQDLFSISVLILSNLVTDQQTYNLSDVIITVFVMAQSVHVQNY